MQLILKPGWTAEDFDAIFRRISAARKGMKINGARSRRRWDQVSMIESTAYWKEKEVLSEAVPSS